MTSKFDISFENITKVIACLVEVQSLSLISQNNDEFIYDKAKKVLMSET